MQAKGWMFFNVLANRYHSGSKETLLQYGPDSDSQEAASYDVSAQDTSFATLSHQEKLGRIHYSWLLGVFEKLPENFRHLVINSLSPNQSADLKKHLGMEKGEIPPTPVAEFITQLFFDRWIEEEDLPATFLPQTRLSFLLEFDKQQLIELADHLGLYDLSHDFRQIVDKARLQKLFGCLTSSMQKFLKVCLVQRDWLQVPPMPLSNWKGDKASLYKMIHRRGLERLGKALSGQKKPLVTAISRRLDTGRGQILLKNYSEEPLESVATALETQVLNLVKFINDNR